MKCDIEERVNEIEKRLDRLEKLIAQVYLISQDDIELLSTYIGTLQTATISLQELIMEQNK